LRGFLIAALTVTQRRRKRRGQLRCRYHDLYGSVTSSVGVRENVVFFFQSIAPNRRPKRRRSYLSHWPTTPGLNYQVLYTTNLATTGWTNLGARYPGD